ncbi:MAG: hypothetical protein IPN68_16495 [Bacteroidetes bacterium]|nr:hypothetical protein [Bacteroidota bacterium]
MKIKHLLFISLMFMPLICLSQPSASWDKWKWLTGEWQSEGSGIPGEGTVNFSFSFELDSSILERRSHSDYSAGDFKRRTIRDDIMIVYLKNGLPGNAISFDNEGHTIKYNITYKDSTITLTSENDPGSPAFRLIYKKINSNSVNTTFEISRDGVNFMIYTEGISKKINKGGLK